jgi:hypothetical protein
MIIAFHTGKHHFKEQTILLLIKIMPDNPPALIHSLMDGDRPASAV